MLLSKSPGNRSSGSGEDFEGFLPYLHAGVVAMWPMSCDPDTTHKPLFPLPMEASHKICLQVDWQSGFGGDV